MSRSTDARRIALAVVVASVIARSASAQENSVRVYESTFTKAAAAMAPMRISKTLTVSIPIPNPLFPLYIHWVDVSCSAVATVTGIAFDIKPAGVTVTGNVATTICGIAAPGASINTGATVAYDSSIRALRVTTNATTVRPQVTFHGQTVRLPVTVNVGPPLTVPTIPVHSAAFVMRVASGTRTLRLRGGDDVHFALHDGFLELNGDVLVQ